MRLGCLLPANRPTALVVLPLHAGCRGWGGGHCNPKVATDIRVHTYRVVSRLLGWDQDQRIWLERGAGFSSHQDMSFEGFLRARRSFAREEGCCTQAPWSQELHFRMLLVHSPPRQSQFSGVSESIILVTSPECPALVGVRPHAEALADLGLEEPKWTLSFRGPIRGHISRAQLPEEICHLV